MTSITVKKNKCINLSVPEFVCDDNPIGEHLNNYDMLKHLNSYSFDVIIGKPGSGKTSLLVGFLTCKGKNKIYRKCFNNVLVVMPTVSRNSLKTNIFENHPEEKLYDSLNLESINDIYTKLQEYSAENENTLLILDDVGASLKDNTIQKVLKTIIYNRRHLKCKIVMLIQSYKSSPLDIRKLVTNIFMFKPSKMEFETLFHELFEQYKDLTIEIMKLVFTEPHKYLMLNVDSQKIYNGFDEIIINNDSN
jgi:KaiC/GvpD/RAD55 family RecA-like ATPase